MSDQLEEDQGFEELLTPVFLPANNETFHQKILEDTQRILRRRRRVRKCLQGAMALLCLGGFYAAGLATMYFLSGSSPEPVIQQEVKQPAPPPAIVEVQPPRPKPQRVDALAQEWQALESVENRALLFRKAGDHYLDEENQIESALRCYNQSLGSGQPMAVTPDDNWLLMAIKIAREKEE